MYAPLLISWCLQMFPIILLRRTQLLACTSGSGCFLLLSPPSPHQLALLTGSHSIAVHLHLRCSWTTPLNSSHYQWSLLPSMIRVGFYSWQSFALMFWSSRQLWGYLERSAREGPWASFWSKQAAKLSWEKHHCNHCSNYPGPFTHRHG